jgi:hypothetical protein
VPITRFGPVRSMVELTHRHRADKLILAGDSANPPDEGRSRFGPQQL